MAHVMAHAASVRAIVQVPRSTAAGFSPSEGRGGARASTSSSAGAGGDPRAASASRVGRRAAPLCVWLASVRRHAAEERLRGGDRDGDSDGATITRHFGPGVSPSRRALLAAAAGACLAAGTAPAEPAAAEDAEDTFRLFESGKPAPVRCLKAMNPKKQGAFDPSNFEDADPVAVGGYTIQGVDYSFWAPPSFKPLTGFLDGASPDPTGTLDVRLEDPSLGTVVVASPKKTWSPEKWEGRTSVEQVGTPEEALQALGSSKLADAIVQSDVSRGPSGQVYYTYELGFKSPPGMHRFLTLTVAPDGRVVVLTAICGAIGLSATQIGALWTRRRETFRKIAASFRVAEPPASSA